MIPVTVSATAESRIKGLIIIRDCTRNLIELQADDYPEEDIKAAQELLNTKYDNFTDKYGLINSRANKSAFSDDSSFALVSALEILGDEGQLERKADIFFKRTIMPHKPITQVDTASEALAVSIGEKACIDMEYMQSLTGKEENELFNDLKGVIFLNPLYEDNNENLSKYFTADEYLSGNVREKLSIARNSAKVDSHFNINVEALEKVQPEDLTASEISVRLGSTWLPVDIVQQFIYEFLNTPGYAKSSIIVHYSKYTGEWSIDGKSYDRSNVKAYNTELIARYEIRHNIPEPDRITEWFGDYAMYTSKKLDKEEMNNIFATKFVKLLLDEWFNGFRGEKSIEKEFFEHISRLNSEYCKNTLSDNLDDWERAIINELDDISEQVASGNIPILQERTKIYIDMDGTIARFHDENLYLERMFEKGFFRDLKPFENAVAAIEKLVNDSTAEIYILSATLNSCSLDEKNQWLDKYLPNIDKDHRIFTSLNVPKSEAIGHQLTDKDILIDDYNKNLLEWEKAGGTSVKAKNNINHKGLHGELWKGEIVDVVNGDIYSDICKLANENYYYAYISQSDVEQLKQSGICYHLRMSGERIIAKVNIIDKPILDNIVDNNRSVNCATGSTIKI